MTQSAGFLTEMRKPLDAAGTRTIARKVTHAIARTKPLRGLYPRRSRISGTTTNGTTIATAIAPKKRSVAASPSMDGRTADRTRRFCTTPLTPHHPSSGRERHETRGDRRGGDGPWRRGAGGPARSRRPDAGPQDRVRRPRPRTDPLVSRQARREEADHPGAGGRGARTDSRDRRPPGRLSRCGLRDRGGLRGPGAEEEGLPGTRRRGAGEGDPRVEHVRVADHADGERHEATAKGRRDAFLQPADAHGARRGHPRRHDERRDPPGSSRSREVVRQD